MLSAQKPVWFTDDLVYPLQRAAPCPGHHYCTPVTLELLQGLLGCGAVAQEEALQDCVWVMLLHCRAEGLPCPEMFHQGSWHSQASSQLTALSHPSLGRGFGNAAAFSGCLDFCLFLHCCFPGIPENSLGGHTGCWLLTLKIPFQTMAMLWPDLCTCSALGTNGP